MQVLQNTHTRNLELINLLPSFLLGFLALSFQIFLLREFSAHFYGNEITYGLLLASWLLWGGVGSISASKFSFRPSMLSRVYYLVILAFPLSLLCLRFSRFFLKILPGEMTGLTTAIVFSMILSFFISSPLGILFVFNVFFRSGNLMQVYLLESLGASLGGLAAYFFLIPFFSNWQGVAIVGGFSSLLTFLTLRRRKEGFLFVLSLVALSAFVLLDIPTQKIYWTPFHLMKSKDSRYGKLQCIKTEEQISLYNNSLLVYSHPDLASSEESIHFALLQNPQAKNVLLIGGGVGGSLKQLLKYSQVEVDYVELDPEIISLSLQLLPEEEKMYLKSGRVQIYFEDGRAFLYRVEKKYDIIILNLPEPSTAQINRFYTKEFFLKAKEKLTEKGLVSFRVPSAENYVSLELQNFLSSLYFTLKEIFAKIEIVPGDTNIFLASDRLLSIDFEELNRKIEKLDLQNSFVSPHLLFSRLNRLRVDLLKEKITKGKRIINLDLIPISYFYTSILWSTQFKGIEKRVLSFFSEINSFWLLDLPLLVFILFLLLLWLRGKKTNFFLVPLAVMGFTTIVAEIIIIIFFQTQFGYLYRRIALLLTSFMTGLLLGAFRGTIRKKYHFSQILFIQFGFLLLLLLLNFSLKLSPPEFSSFLFLLVLGFLGGDLFVVSNNLFLEERKNYGLGYGLDLLGSFSGALIASTLIIPLFGLPLLVKYLFILNSFCFLFLVGGLRKL
ncbi:MAG: spermidine synthase [Candidatus Aminicenantaceae bacterium]